MRECGHAPGGAEPFQRHGLIPAWFVSFPSRGLATNFSRLNSRNHLCPLSPFPSQPFPCARAQAETSQIAGGFPIVGEGTARLPPARLANEAFRPSRKGLGLLPKSLPLPQGGLSPPICSGPVPNLPVLPHFLIS